MADSSFDVPLPAGALDAEPWQDDTHRQFWGTTYIHDAAVQPSKGVRLGIWGLQDISGTVLTRRILIEADPCGTEVDSATAGRIETDLRSLRDELDALSDPDDTIGIMSSEDAASDAAKGLSDATEASHLMDTRAAPPAEPELQAETAGEMIPTPAYSEVLEEPDYREEERFAAVKYVAPMLVAAVLGAAGMFTYINARPAITPPVPPAKIITDPAPPAKILPPPPIPPPGPAQDEAFATALRDSWITWPRDDDMIDAGHEICLRLSADDDPQQLVDRLIASAADPASHRESAEAIVGAAIKYFCPDDSLATLLHTY